MCRCMYHLKPLHFVHMVYLCVSCSFQNKVIYIYSTNLLVVVMANDSILSKV
jgi:hypothetical protein